MNLVVVGSVGLDDVETPAGKVECALGGSAIYFSLTASMLTGVGFVGVVGEDFPEDGVEILRSKGVDLRGLERTSGRTFRWSGRYHEDMNQRDTLATELNCLETFSPKLPDDYRNAPFLFLGNIHPALQIEVLDQARGPEFVAMDTMNFWIDGAPDELQQVLGRVDALTINDEEARDLSGHSNIVRAAQEIQRMGPELVVIKRGEYGALISKGSDFFFAPAFPLEDVVDPTGAGDSFAGGFMGFVARQESTSWPTLCQATVAGSTLASFCVEEFSVEALRHLTPERVNARAEAFRRITTFPMLAV